MGNVYAKPLKTAVTNMSLEYPLVLRVTNPGVACVYFAFEDFLLSVIAPSGEKVYFQGHISSFPVSPLGPLPIMFFTINFVIAYACKAPAANVTNCYII